MTDYDIAQIRKFMDDAIQRANDTSDKGCMGQWNTFNYIANSPDAKAWAAGTKVGSDLLAKLKERGDFFHECIEEVVVFNDIIEQLLQQQEKINNGNF